MTVQYNSIDLSGFEFDAIIFDCDGTLADNMPLHFQAWKYAVEKNGASFILTPEMILKNAGKGMHEVIGILNREFGDHLEASKIAAAKDEYFEIHHMNVEPIPEVMEVVNRYKGKIPMSVASGSRTVSVKRTLEHLGIEGLFCPIVTVDDVEHGKPAPDMFLKAAGGMGVAPERCIVFEDGELGIQAAKACGMAWIRVESRL